MGVYAIVKDFKKKYPGTVAFRLKKHSEVVEKHLNPNERVLFAFCGQKNVPSLMFVNSCVVALTNKRIIIGQKRLLWGYNLLSITPDMFNDFEVYKGLIFGKVEIDTIKEVVDLSDIDPKALVEIETQLSEYLLKVKPCYMKENM